MNGQANCILEVCCESASAFAALSDEMVKEGVGTKEYCDKAAKFVYKHFDLAPRGSLRQFKDEVKRLARENGGRDHD